ncbi:MAG: DUF2796 domain-containing protein [Cellvibrionaceae bacterium]|nr:DUF2796 domain-containing protein [Cellvibrionaceae bacterium]
MTKYLVFVLFLLVTPLSFSVEKNQLNHDKHDDHDTGSHGAQADKDRKVIHDAHTHGLGLLTLVFEAGELLLELETPAANILGFEHRPQTAEERQKLQWAERLFNNAKEMFGLPPNCQLKNLSLELPFPSPDGKHGHEPREHDEGKHGEGLHQDIHAEYQWRCDEPPRKIAVNLFKHFPAFENIDAQWIIQNKQGAASLSPKQSTITIAH